MVFEYLCIVSEKQPAIDGVESYWTDALNVLGAEGWEAFAALPGREPWQMVFMLKRSAAARAALGARSHRDALRRAMGEQPARPDVRSRRPPRKAAAPAPKPKQQKR